MGDDVISLLVVDDIPNIHTKFDNNGPSDLRDYLSKNRHRHGQTADRQTETRDQCFRILWGRKRRENIKVANRLMDSITTLV